MITISVSALVVGALAGLVFGLCGIRPNNWRFWVLLLAFCIAHNIGRIFP